MMRSLFGLSLIVVFALFLVGCSSGESQSDGSTVPADVQQVIDDYTSAIVAQDVDAWRETLTDGYIYRRGMYSPQTQERSEPDSYEEDTADPYAHRIEFKTPVEYEQLGDPIVTGDGPWFVTIPQRWIELSEPDQVAFDGNGTFVVVERDGVMKVDAEYWTGTQDFLED